MYELIAKVFSKHGILFKNIIGSSFDGAANMQGQYNGLRSHIKTENKNSVYIWCYAHILNLCVCDICGNVAALNLFGLLNRLATFFSDSYKRMNVWKEIQENLGTGQKKMRRLQKIGATRWWSREKALKWVFEGDDCLFPLIINALHFVETSKTFDPKTTSEAISLKDKLCEFNIIITAYIFLPIFKSIGPTSTYLQTKNLDILSAFLMVEKCIVEISRLNFEDILKASKGFALKMNGSFIKTKISEDITVEDDFSETRIRRKKRMFDEMSNDEAPTDPKLKFKIEVFQSILDQLQTSLNDRFSNNKCIIADMQYLLPKYYNDVKNKLIPESALNQLSILSSVNRSKLIDELEHFATIYSQLVEPLCKKTSHMYNTSNEDHDFIQNDIDYENLNLEWDCEISKTSMYTILFI